MNMKRMRGRGHRPNGGGGGGFSRNQQNGIPLNRNHVFDSSGPEMRVRGTAQQLYDKYQQLARDAAANGDRILCEAYYQHAEHYFRIIAAINQAQGQPNPQNPGQNGQHHERGGDYPPRRDYQPAEAGEFVLSENRPEPARQDQNRRFEPRPYEQRPRPEFARQDRPERQDRQERQDRPERDRHLHRAPQEQLVDAPIDISSALEAELAAASAEPPGFGEQPFLDRPAPAPEARAIPIIPDAPPPAEATPAPRRPRTRTRKPAAEAAPESTPEE